MNLQKYFSTPLLLIIISACSSLTLKPADYSWPIENVLKVDNKGFVEEQRYSFTLKVKALFYEEFKDSTNFSGKEIRLIRDKVGFYYITGKDFKNVYVFEPEENGMDLENKIMVTEAGLVSPAFNQKSPNIELLDNSNKYLLNNKGIVR
ncbi:MAG: hypothetical protein D4R68_03290 [Ignavibacteriales bacterium]|nr:MAG: hypothetical protein D4R68_03290 [Ignavibacteriales bacterium]